jgi:hypothetical protein
MKRINNCGQLLALAAVTVALGAGVASASEIYRYTDANGEVYYVDRPTGAPDEELVPIASRSSSSASSPTRTARNNTSYRSEETVEETPPEQMTRAQRAEKARQTEVRCQQLRDQLDSYMNAHRLYREDDSGERQYLDDAEIDEARNKVTQQIAETCK